MRLLVTTPYSLWPESSGGARRTLGIARALSALGHEVTLLARGHPLPSDALSESLSSFAYGRLGRLGHFFNPRFSRALDSVLSKGQDAVIASFPYQAATLVPTCRRYGVPLIYDAHNVEAERFSSTGKPLLAFLISRVEEYLTRHADAVLAVSAEDRKSFRVRYGRTPLLLPNGVDTHTFAPGTPDPHLLRHLGLTGKYVALYCGSFDYEPNREALAYLLEMNWPISSPGRPDTHLLVVGRRPPAYALRRPGVMTTGEVTDLVPYLRLAHLVLAPLMSGGGTRLKIIEALACGQQVLSTHFGAAGLGDREIPGLHLCTLDAFEPRLRRLLMPPLVPGRNDAGRRWALDLSWRALVGAIEWQRLTTSPNLSAPS